jgi:hypothetical protein
MVTWALDGIRYHFRPIHDDQGCELGPATADHHDLLEQRIGMIAVC